MLKLDGSLRADAPALTASSAFGHIVVECPSVVLIIKTQGRSRTIFHAGQTSVAVLIYSKIRHIITLMVFNLLNSDQFLRFFLFKKKVV
jgi:hypothetical protein